MIIFEVLASTQKGVVYLPVVSLSSYLPVAGQIALMILVISLSGVFGAWLMFQRLAKKVLALETTQAVAAAQPAVDVVVAAAKLQEVKPFEVRPVEDVQPQPRVSGARARKKEKARLKAEAKAEAAKSRSLLLPTVSTKDAIPKHKRTLFVSKSVQNKSAAADRLVLARTAPAAASAAPAATTTPVSNSDETRVVPQTFLVNDWFPMDQ